MRTDPAGANLFAARADTPFGALGSLVALSGIWNAQAVPLGYGGLPAAFWLVVVALAGAGYVLLARPARLAPGLGAAGLIGLAVAALGVSAPGRAVLRDLISAWAGFAVLRDGQQYVAALALTEAIGLGAAVAWAARGVRITPGSGRASGAIVRGCRRLQRAQRHPRRGRWRRSEGEPRLAWPPSSRRSCCCQGWRGDRRRLHAVRYPADWMTARQLIDGDPAPGTVLLLPWALYRRYPWNGGEAVFDPWPRLLARDVIANDALTVGSQTLGQESAASIKLNGVIAEPGPLTGKLRAAGVRYVVVDAGPLLDGPRAGLAAAARLPGAQVLMAGRDLVVFRLTAPGGQS